MVIRSGRNAMEWCGTAWKVEVCHGGWLGLAWDWNET